MSSIYYDNISILFFILNYVIAYIQFVIITLQMQPMLPLLMMLMTFQLLCFCKQMAHEFVKSIITAIVLFY